jgi:Na+-translocating ferredoxin:NAD+ oxidoreductase RnfE subunit
VEAFIDGWAMKMGGTMEIVMLGGVSHLFGYNTQILCFNLVAFALLLGRKMWNII